MPSATNRSTRLRHSTLLLALAFAPSCASTVSAGGPGGETHFLCAKTSDCAVHDPALVCVSGECRRVDGGSSVDAATPPHDAPSSSEAASTTCPSTVPVDGEPCLVSPDAETLTFGFPTGCWYPLHCPAKPRTDGQWEQEIASCESGRWTITVAAEPPPQYHCPCEPIVVGSACDRTLPFDCPCAGGQCCCAGTWHQGTGAPGWCVFPTDGGSDAASSDCRVDAASRFAGSCAGGCPAGTICAFISYPDYHEYCAPIPASCAATPNCACFASCVCGGGSGEICMAESGGIFCGPGA